MANDAVHTQLPIMVRRPKVVWPGLDRMDLHRKMIAGDGNCLFASLADQLYGSPAKHLEVRAAVVQHMRDFRPLFENVAIKDDIQQKRATRAVTSAIRNSTSDDNFEDYLTIMSKSGSYGGEPELVAFTQCYDQDVWIHLPRMSGYPDSIEYNNQYRSQGAENKPHLHLCYGGDEISGAHYDSARKNKPVIPVFTGTERTIPVTAPILRDAPESKQLTPRAIRNSKADIQRDIMHELVLKGEFAQLQSVGRTRSPSISSSHNSTSSKRSLDEEEVDSQRPAKRADRRRNTRRQLESDPATILTSAAGFKVKLSSGLATPASTQDSESSSDQSDRSSDIGDIKQRPRRSPISRSLTPETSSDSAKTSRKSSITLKPAISTETMITAPLSDS